MCDTCNSGTAEHIIGDGIDPDENVYGGETTDASRPDYLKDFGPICKEEFSLLRCPSGGSRLEIHGVFYGWREDESPCGRGSDVDSTRHANRLANFTTANNKIAYSKQRGQTLCKINFTSSIFNNTDRDFFTLFKSIFSVNSSDRFASLIKNLKNGEND